MHPVLQSRLRRMKASSLAVLQCSIAASLAWALATGPIGHPRPFFAPIAAVVCLGVSLGARLRRSVELVAGVSLGILVGDLLIARIGPGTWQIGLVVALAMSTAVLLDGGGVFTLQAGSSSVLVATLLPPGGSAGLNRFVDALVGGVVGIVVIALIPADPVRTARRDAARVLSTLAAATRQIATGLAARDEAELAAALGAARSTQGTVDALRADLAAGRELARIAPLRWHSRARLSRLLGTADPIDNAARNLRVLARRALAAVRDDEPVDERIIAQLQRFSDSVELLRQAFASRRGQPPDVGEAARALRLVAAGMASDLGANGGLSVTVVVGQLRSTVVDLLQVAGASRVSALASLPPTVAHPPITPDIAAE